MKRILLATAALVSLLPILQPSTQVYVDNAPHLVEVAAMADAWPSVVSWTDRANVGMVVGQLNAPLAWWPLAGGVKAGLPLAPLYVFCVFLSNLVFGFGAYKLGQRLVGDTAGWIAAVLVTCSAFDLYGIAGAAGGMWPFRLSCGLLMYGIGARWRSGLWLAAVMLLHTFGAVAAVMATLAMATREPRRLLHLLLALALSAFWWGPLLDPALRGFQGFWAMGPLDTLMVSLFPGEVLSWRLLGKASAVGGVPGLAFIAVAGVGAAISFLRPKIEDRTLALQLGAVVVVFLVGGAVLYPLLEFSLLGPNPWRHYLWVRVALAMAAGVGLQGLPERAQGLLAVGLGILAAWAGGRELVMQPGLTEDLRATWALAPEGRVYHEDSMFKPGAPLDLTRGHAGALLGLEREVLGSWYTVSSIATVGPAASEAGGILGQVATDLDVEALHRSLRVYGATSLVSVSGLDLGAPFFQDLGGEGPFRLWRVLGEEQPLVGARDGDVSLTSTTATIVVATVPEGPFRVRKTWHPWWSATLDGEPLELEAGNSGLIEGTAPGAGQLMVSWSNQGLRWAWISLAGSLFLVGMSLRARFRSDRRPRP